MAEAGYSLIVFAKRPLLVDSLIVVALLGLQVAVLVGADEQATGWLPGWGALAVSVLGLVPLLVRRRHPRVVFVVVLTAALVLMLGVGGTGAVGLGLQVAVYTIATSSSLLVSVITAMVALVASVVGTARAGLPPEGLLADLVIVTGAVGLGRVTRRSAERARRLEHVVHQLEEAREQLVVEAAMIERNRIARELHDVVSHSLGVIAVQAGVGRAMPEDHRQAHEALKIIEATTKDTLAEMRHLLGALRAPDPPDAELQPQPGLAQLDTLLQNMRDSGLSLTMVTEGEPPPLTAGQELTVYRIVQEALTNVLKHAGRTTVRVSLRYLNDMLRIEVLNDGAAATTGEPGYGLVGMRERALVCGGSLEAGRLPGDRFRVVATLPSEHAQVIR